MSQLGDCIADAAVLGLRYADRLTAHIPDSLFARMACPGGQVIHSNHPAFIIGHLCLYPPRIAALLGMPEAIAALPAEYEKLFSKESVCQDDPQGELYPSKAELMTIFDGSYSTALELIRSAEESLLLGVNPSVPLREVCPTLGSMLAFYVGGHVATHLGQLSAWRRMQGLGAA
jgi:hypothetical protein